MPQDLSTDYSTLMNKLHGCSEIIKPVLLNLKSIQENRLQRHWKAMIRFYRSCQELISTIEHDSGNLLNCLLGCEAFGRKLVTICNKNSNKHLTKISRIVRDCLNTLGKYRNNLRWY